MNATNWEVRAYLKGGELAFSNTYDTHAQAVYAKSYYEKHGFEAEIVSPQRSEKVWLFRGSYVRVVP